MSAEGAPTSRADGVTPEVRVPGDANIVELAAGWASAAGSRVKTTAELALAEARLAVLSLGLMLILAIFAAVFVLGAWGLLMAGAVTALLAVGVSTWISLAGLGALHLLFAWLLLRWMARLSIHLELPETRRQLRGAPGPENSDGIG